MQNTFSFLAEEDNASLVKTVLNYMLNPRSVGFVLLKQSKDNEAAQKEIILKEHIFAKAKEAKAFTKIMLNFTLPKTMEEEFQKLQKRTLICISINNQLSYAEELRLKETLDLATDGIVFALLLMVKMPDDNSPFFALKDLASRVNTLPQELII